MSSCLTHLRTSEAKHLPPPRGACYHHLVGRQQQSLADIAHRMRERARELQEALPQGAAPELYIGLGDQGGNPGGMWRCHAGAAQATITIARQRREDID